MTSDVYEDIKPKKIKPVTMEDGTEMVRLTLTRTPLAAPRPPRPGRSTSVGTLALGECWLGEHPHLTSPPPPFDFSYTLLTRAGFTVERRGMESALQLNSDTALALVCATTALRRRSSRPTRVRLGRRPARSCPAVVASPWLVGLRPMTGSLPGSSPNPNPDPDPDPDPDQV